MVLTQHATDAAKTIWDHNLVVQKGLPGKGSVGVLGRALGTRGPTAGRVVARRRPARVR